MKEYLRSSAALIKGFAWAFPAFKRPGGAGTNPDDIDLESLTDEEMDAILEFAFDRYFETSGLFGTVQTCLAQVERVKGVGVDEIGLPDRLRRADGRGAREPEGTRRGAPSRQHRRLGARCGRSISRFAAQVARHGVTHMQCTPSMARMLVLDRDAHAALRQIRHLMIGGEAFPLPLAHELDGLAEGSVTNMYGPTETTIWSSTARVSGKPDADLHRPADRQHAALRAGRELRARARGRRGRADDRRRRRRPRLSRAPGADRRALRSRSVPRAATRACTAPATWPAGTRTARSTSWAGWTTR